MHATTPIGRGRLPLFGADRSYSDLPAQIFVLDALHQPDLWKRTGATPETCPPCNRRMPRYDSASICPKQVVPCSGPQPAHHLNIRKSQLGDRSEENTSELQSIM